LAGVAGKHPMHTEDWQTLPWKQFQRNVFRLQQRIYQAARRGDWQQVHNLQRLLLRSWSARCLAVRQVTQDNRGKRTPGVDGVARLTPKQRLALARDLRDLSGWTVDPIRRIYTSSCGNGPTIGIETSRAPGNIDAIGEGKETEGALATVPSGCADTMRCLSSGMSK